MLGCLKRILYAVLYFAHSRVRKHGAQYITFAAFGAINYPAAYFYEFYVNGATSGLWIRLFAGILCILLLFKDRWPAILQRALPLYWYFTVCFCIPFLGTYMMLKDNFSLGWLINFNIGVMVAILLMDWVSFLFIEFIGILAGVIIFAALGNHLIALPHEEYTYLFFYMFLCITILGTIFSRSREVFNNVLYQAQDDINKTLALKVKERTVELEKALNAKTEFLNNISHEIRTPMQGFTAISEGLVEHWHQFDDKKRLELAAQIAKNAKRLSSLASNLLDLSKFVAGKIILENRSFNFVELVENIVDESQVLYLGTKKLHIEFSKSPPIVVIGDYERIGQVLRNLFINAIKFSPTDGAILVKVCKTEIKKSGGTIVEAVDFSITDHGVGIPEEELSIIFDAFTQSSATKNKGGGTGLGLAISRKIIESHGGNIWARNNAGPGSTFEFIIPLVAPRVPHKLPQNLPLKRLGGKDAPYTLMIIDDEESCLIGMELLLYGQHYNIIKMNSGKEALKYLTEGNPSVDLIMLDLMMPDMYGMDVLETLKSIPKLEQIPVILQSGAVDPREIERAYDLGIVYVLKKPYQKEVVLAEIASIIQRYYHEPMEAKSEDMVSAQLQ